MFKDEFATGFFWGTMIGILILVVALPDSEAAARKVSGYHMITLPNGSTTQVDPFAR